MREVVEACVEPGLRERPPLPRVRYYGFVDPSGGSSDAMTLAIAHREKDIGVLDCLREVRPPFSPEAVVEDFAGTLKSYGVTRVTGDRYGGEWPREQFKKRGVSYELSDKSKSSIYAEFLPLANSGTVRLLDNMKLINQLSALERRTARGTGRDTIDHPPNAHDDLCNAACGVLVVGASAAAARDLRFASLSWVTSDAGYERRRENVMGERPSLWEHPGICRW